MTPNTAAALRALESDFRERAKEPIQDSIAYLAYNYCADRIAAVLTQEGADAWRCFHCDETFTTDESAREHFGASLSQCAACQIDIAEYRRMEEKLQRYCEEDTELHREILRLNSAHAVALRQEEEKGYARGLRDARAAAQSEPRAAEGAGKGDWCGISDSGVCKNPDCPTPTAAASVTAGGDALPNELDRMLGVWWYWPDGRSIRDTDARFNGTDTTGAKRIDITGSPAPSGGVTEAMHWKYVCDLLVAAGIVQPEKVEQAIAIASKFYVPGEHMVCGNQPSCGKTPVVWTSDGDMQCAECGHPMSPAAQAQDAGPGQPSEAMQKNLGITGLEEAK